MILTDVYVPSLNATYDFQLNENVRIGALTLEIAEILLRKAGGPTEDDAEEEEAPVRTASDRALARLAGVSVEEYFAAKEPQKKTKTVDLKAFTLYSPELQCSLRADRTLDQCGIRSGSRLLLV